MENNNQIELLLEAGVYNTYSTHKFENRKPYQKRSENEVISEIPGTIVRLLAKVGDKIAQGEPLLVLEAMKMENIIRMPQNGEIKQILVEKGQKISKYTTMVIFE